MGVVAIGLISRFLGTENFGVYATLLAYGAIIQVAADLGLYLTLTRSIAQDPQNENTYLGASITLRITILLIVFGVGAAIADKTPSLQNATTAYLLIAAGLITQSISQLLMGIYQHRGTIWRASVGDVGGRILHLGGIIGLGATRASLTSMAALFMAGSFITTALHRLFLPKEVQPKLIFSWPVWRKMIVTSLPLGALLVLNTIYFRIDIVLLSLFRTGSEVGLYGLAYRLVESLLFFPAMFGGLLLPRISVAWQNKDTEKLKQYIGQGLFAVAWAATFVVPSLIVMAEPIVLLIAGNAYQEAAPLLQILSLAVAAMFAGNVAGFALVATHRQKTLLVLATALACANIALGIATIPRWGALAAAWTTVATEITAASIACLVMYRVQQFSIKPAIILKTALVAILTILVYHVVPESWPTLVILCSGGIVYIVGSLWLGILTREQFNVLLWRHEQKNL